MRYVVFLTALFVFRTLHAGIVENIGTIEKLDALDTPFFLPGERETNLIPQMRARKEALRLRLDYPNAWKLYSSGSIDDFSYFGFRKAEMESGRITLKAFLRELENHLTSTR